MTIDWISLPSRANSISSHSTCSMRPRGRSITRSNPALLTMPENRSKPRKKHSASEKPERVTPAHSMHSPRL